MPSLDDWRGGGRGFLLVAAADQECGSTARCKGDGKHYNSRNVHNASLTLLRDTATGYTDRLLLT